MKPQAFCARCIGDGVPLRRVGRFWLCDACAREPPEPVLPPSTFAVRFDYPETERLVRKLAPGEVVPSARSSTLAGVHGGGPAFVATLRTARMRRDPSSEE